MKKLIKPTITVLAASFILLLSGCFLFQPAPEGVSAPEGHYRLHANFSNGVPPGLSADEGLTYIPSQFKDVPIKSELFKSESEPYYGYTQEAYEEAVMEMAEYLSEWTGLDFILNGVSTDAEGDLIIDWSKDSTLLAGLDGREQKEDFHFVDSVTLNWFMMDTLYSTLYSNFLNIVNSPIYYCSDGQLMEFPNQEDMEAQGLTALSVDEPYRGSDWYCYYAHLLPQDDRSGE